MVVIIHISKSIRNIFNYNENKLKLQQAELIHSGNYPKDTELLSHKDKINRLIRQAALNDRAILKACHIFLNFHATEKPDREKLKAISDAYMAKIGFGEQPYLVYRHLDAAHDHVHIVTIQIKPDGKFLDIFSPGYYLTKKASFEIEQEFNLIHTLEKSIAAKENLPSNTLRMQYGKTATLDGIARILDHVLPNYKYCSLEELNAVLKLYNIRAEAVGKKSLAHQHKGLLYRVLDQEGKRIGVPIKASLIPGKPLLPFIESQFRANEAGRQQHKQRLCLAIDFALASRHSLSMEEWNAALQKQQIHVDISRNGQGNPCSSIYIDHRSKCVFSERDLGEAYTLEAIRQRLKNLGPESAYAQSLTRGWMQETILPNTAIENQNSDSPSSLIQETEPKPDTIISLPGDQITVRAQIKKMKHRLND